MVRRYLPHPFPTSHAPPSARGLAHSRTLRKMRSSPANAERLDCDDFGSALRPPGSAAKAGALQTLRLIRKSPASASRPGLRRPSAAFNGAQTKRRDASPQSHAGSRKNSLRFSAPSASLRLFFPPLRVKRVRILTKPGKRNAAKPISANEKEPLFSWIMENSGHWHGLTVVKAVSCRSLQF